MLAESENTGGSFTTGGSTSGTGGKATGGGANSANVATGGKTGGSGAGGTGSFSSGGGGTASGGATGSGGTGGSPSSGGTSGNGGSGGTSGTGGTGGAATTGGSGGTPATGGTPSAGGTPAAGGSVGATGGTATGGTPATGGSGGTPASGCGGNTNGLVACWLFDEASGTTAADSSGNNHTLTMVGSAGCATLGSTGKAGNRLTLGKGTPLYNDCSGAARKASVNLGSLTAVTVSVWVKNESGSDNYGYQAGLLQFENVFTLGWDADNIGWYAGERESEPGGPTGNAWHHIAATWSTANGELHVYLNGDEVGSGFNATTPASGAHQLLVGRVVGETRGFSGGIDNLRIYNRVLSAAEIAALFATP